MTERGDTGKGVFTEQCRSCGAPERHCLRCGDNGGAEESRAISDEEFSLLVSVCVWRGSASGNRDAIIFVLMRSYGFSASDIEHLEFEDWVQDQPALNVRARRTHPARDSRIVPLDGVASDLLLRWVLVRGYEPGRMFLPVSTQGRSVSGAQLSRKTVMQAIRKRGLQAGLGPLRIQDMMESTSRSVDTEQGDADTHRRVSRLKEVNVLRLSAAAKAIAASYALREGEEEPCALSALTTEELQQLRRRVAVVLLRRRIGREASDGTTSRSPLAGTVLESVKKMVAEAAADGVHENEIARVCGFNQSDVHIWSKRYRRGKTLTPWAKKMGTRERRVLEEDLLGRPYASMPQRREHLASVCGVRVSVKTLAAHAEDLGFRRIQGMWTRKGD